MQCWVQLSEDLSDVVLWRLDVECEQEGASLSFLRVDLNLAVEFLYDHLSNVKTKTNAMRFRVLVVLKVAKQLEKLQLLVW